MYFSLQGVSLAQDRGRLEARIEVLGTELETQKKQNERDNDALKIKAKIIDDQTETIRKLKEVVGYFDYWNQCVVVKAKQQKSPSYHNLVWFNVHICAFYQEHCVRWCVFMCICVYLSVCLSVLSCFYLETHWSSFSFTSALLLSKALQERDEQIRRLREEAVQVQKRSQQKLDEETAQQAELRERLEHLSLRKEELKQQLEDKEAELEEVKRVYRQASHHKHLDILEIL